MWWTSSLTWYFYSSTIIRPKMARNDTDFVYNFCNTLTVVDESENKDTCRSFRVGPKASRANYTTFNSLKVICF
jgi:hypothetical protein